MTRRRDNALRIINGGGRGGGWLPPGAPPVDPPIGPVTQEQANEIQRRNEIREQLREEMLVCPACGSPYVEQVPRAPSVIANMLGIFCGLLMPPPLNIFLAIWGAKSMVTVYHVWFCRSCRWEGRNLGSWKLLTNACKWLCFIAILLSGLGWLVGLYRKVAS